MILTTGCNHWADGLDVVVEGTAVQLEDEAMLERLAAAWATKWDGRWRYELRDAGLDHGGSAAARVFAVAPTKILAFAKGTFSQTRHQF